jgi:hypothetical protein
MAFFPSTFSLCRQFSGQLALFDIQLTRLRYEVAFSISDSSKSVHTSCAVRTRNSLPQSLSFCGHATAFRLVLTRLHLGQPCIWSIRSWQVALGVGSWVQPLPSSLGTFAPRKQSAQEPATIICKSDRLLAYGLSMMVLSRSLAYMVICQ